jgi:hypothetical protein
MDDKTALPGQTKIHSVSKEDTPGADALDTSESIENKTGEGVAGPRQGIFDTRLTAVMTAFGDACDQHGIATAIAIAIHPDDEQPMLLIRGHQFDATALAARVLRKLQTALIQELNGDQEDEDA